MKIDATTPSSASLQKTRQQKPVASLPAAAESTAASDVSAVRHLQGSDQAGAPVDSQRVEEIRQAIADGRLTINAERIADRLIEGVRQQLAKD